jgi:hypothetical protein
MVLDIPSDQVFCSPEGRHMHSVFDVAAARRGQKVECCVNKDNESLKRMAMSLCCSVRAHGKVNDDRSSVSLNILDPLVSTLMAPAVRARQRGSEREVPAVHQG